MPAPTLSDVFQVGVDILGTSVSSTTKRVLLQTGSVVGQTADASNVEHWQTVGLISRPPKPDAGKVACQAIVLRQGGNDVCVALQDTRGLALAGQLADGETCLYGPGEDGKAQGRVLIKKDGSVHVFTKEGNTDGGKGITISVGSDGSITVASSKGNAVLLGSDGSVNVFNASGGLEIKPDGSINLASGAKVQISGASVTMGGPSAQPLALGIPTSSAIAAIQTQLSALASALTAVAAAASLAPGASGAAAAAVPGQVAVQSGAAQIATISPQIACKRCSGD